MLDTRDGKPDAISEYHVLSLVRITNEIVRRRKAIKSVPRVDNSASGRKIVLDTEGIESMEIGGTTLAIGDDMKKFSVVYKLAVRRVLTPAAAAALLSGDESATDAGGHELIANEIRDITREQLEKEAN